MSAQESEEESTEQEVIAPEPISIAEIGPHWDETNVLLHSIESRLADESSFARLRRSVAGATSWRRGLESDTALERMDRLSRRELFDRSARWHELEQRLERVQETLATHSEGIESELSRLDDEEGIWTITLEAMTADEHAPEISLAQVRSALSEINAMRGKVIESLTPTLELQRELGEDIAVVNRVLEQISGAERDAAARLWQRSSPPAWSSGDEVSMPLQRQVDAAWNQHTHALSRVTTRERLHLFQYLLLCLLVLGWVRHRVRVSEWRPSSAAATWVLLSVIAAPWVFAALPQVLLELIGLVSGVALLFVVPRHLPLNLSALCVGVYAMDWTRRLLAEGTAVHRYSLLVATTLLLILAIGAWRRRVRFAGGVSLIAVLALALAIWGYVPLAGVIVESVATAALATAALYSVLQLLRLAIDDALRSRVAAMIHSIGAHKGPVRSGLRGVAIVATTLAWAWTTTGAMQLRNPILTDGKQWLTTPWKLGELSVQPMDVLLFFAIMFVAVVLARAVSTLLTDDVLPRVKVEKSAAHTFGTLTRITILTLGLLGAASAAGVAPDRIALVVGALGVGIGFGLQTVVNNFASGLILMFERPIRVGDTVQVGGVVGIVRDIGIRASCIETLDGSEVHMPNSNLVQGNLTNWDGSDATRRVTLPVGVGYESDLNEVQALLSDLLAKHPKVLDIPEPAVHFVGFGASSLDFELRFWVPAFGDGRPALSEVGQACHYSLQQAGVAIPFPQMDLHLPKSDSAEGSEDGVS